MSANIRNASNSNVYASLSTVTMTSGDRARAVAALEDGEKIAEFVLGAARMLRAIGELSVMKPTFKHQ